LNDADGREQLGMTLEADALLANCHTVARRVESGADASCLSLYQATQPRLLGATAPPIERGGLRWGATQADSAAEQANPWLLLDREPRDVDGAPAVPAVVDFNTATYSLHKGLGDTIEVLDSSGNTARLEIVGMLKNSIFQGDVLVGEAAFLEL